MLTRLRPGRPRRLFAGAAWDGTASDFNGDFYPEYPMTAGAAAWVGPGSLTRSREGAKAVVREVRLIREGRCDLDEPIVYSCRVL